MEIGQQAIDGFELVGGSDENIGFARARLQLEKVRAWGLLCQAFKHAGDSGSGGDYTAASCPGGVDGASALLADMVALGMHVMVLDILRLHRAESAHPNMQGKEGVGYVCQNFRSEMQSRSGGGNGALLTRKGGLISLTVIRVALTVHVVRKCKPAMGLLVNGPVPDNDAVTIIQNGVNRARGLADFHSAPWFHLLAGAHEAFPLELRELVGADELYASVIGEEARSDDLGVVEDEQILRVHVACKIGEHAVLNKPGITMDDHHARTCPVFERAAGDKLLRKVIVKISGFEHGAESCAGSFQFQASSMLI